MLIRRSRLDIKEIKIITKSEDIKMGIESEFRAKLRNRTNVTALNFIRCCHAVIVLLIFENVFYFKKTFYRVLFSI